MLYGETHQYMSNRRSYSDLSAGCSWHHQLIQKIEKRTSQAVVSNYVNASTIALSITVASSNALGVNSIPE
jgi:hypothetical protein